MLHFSVSYAQFKCSIILAVINHSEDSFIDLLARINGLDVRTRTLSQFISIVIKILRVILGQVWCMIVSIPDLCHLFYFYRSYIK